MKSQFIERREEEVQMIEHLKMRKDALIKKSTDIINEANVLKKEAEMFAHWSFNDDAVTICETVLAALESIPSNFQLKEDCLLAADYQATEADEARKLCL
jgi:hypothetical protein